MKRLAIILVLTIPVQSVQAGIPVADVPAFAQRLAEITANVQRWRSQLRDMAATASKVSATYDAFTSVTNLHDVVRNPILRDFLPDDYLSIYNDAVELGLGGLFGGELDLTQAGIIRDVCGMVRSAGVKANCNARQTGAYKLQYTSNQVYKNVKERAKQIEKLTNKLSTMSDPKQVMDLQAMISTEVAAIQNESVRIEAMRMAHDASEAVLRQQQSQLASEMWDIQDGVKLTPITFGP